MTLCLMILFFYTLQLYDVIFDITKEFHRIIEPRLRDSVEINQQQYGFMPGKGTTDAMFALLMK